MLRKDAGGSCGGHYLVCGSWRMGDDGGEKDAQGKSYTHRRSAHQAVPAAELRPAQRGRAPMKLFDPFFRRPHG